MADFRGLALQYVLSDDAARQRELAGEAASALMSGEKSGNPVAKWVESIRPWMSTGDDDSMDFGEDGEATGDLVARAKATSFLADTLEHLNSDFFKPAQVSLLLTYFGNMFEIDHKRGILPAAKALGRVINQKAFKPQQADQILNSICKLGDDFKIQAPDTRVVVYELIVQLTSRPDVANDLQYRYGPTSGFMTNLLELCQNERNAKCLMTWLRVLQTFLTEYSPSDDVVTGIFNTFSAYFPISLRESQEPSGITTDDMKAALRRCFSAHHRVARLAFPYLIGRLDQGDAITVNVKLDILSTITACLKRYEHVSQGIVPYVDQIWTSLKYEVRNGEIEDNIKGTLEVIRTLAQRLTGNELRDFALTVQRDCLDDLANPTYTAAAGRLLIGVHSAKPSAFAIMVSPTLTHTKENLRHTKSADHTRSLMVLLNSLLELRAALLRETELEAEDVQAFFSTEPGFISLYREAYALPYHQATNPGAQKETMLIGQEVIKGLGLLVCQPAAQPKQGSGLMLPEQLVADICTDHYTFLLSALRSDDTDEAARLVDETTLALQKASVAHPPTFARLIGELFPDPEDTDDYRAMLQHLLPKMAFIGCSEVALSDDKTSNFVAFIASLLRKLADALDRKSSPDIWVEFASGIQAAVRYFKDACEVFTGRAILLNMTGLELLRLPADPRFDWAAWVPYVLTRFPSLPPIQDESGVQFGEDTGSGVPVASSEDVLTQYKSKEFPVPEPYGQLSGDFLLISLFATRQLFRRATAIVSGHEGAEVSLGLSRDFAAQDPLSQSREDQYLQLIADLAKFVASQMHERHQRDLFLADEVLTLFRSNEVIKDGPIDSESNGVGRPPNPWANHQLREILLHPPSEEIQSLWQDAKSMRNPPYIPASGIMNGRVCILSYGLLAPLSSSPVDKAKRAPDGSDGAFASWVGRYIPHQMLIAGLMPKDASLQQTLQGTVHAMLTSLANKFSVESMGQVLDLMRTQIAFVIDGSNSQAGDGYAGLLEQETGKLSDQQREETLMNLARGVFAAVGGMLRRYKGNYLKPIIEAVVRSPGNKTIGHRLARAFTILFHDHECLSKDYHSFLNPLWRQRAYVEVVKPMLAQAWPAGSNSPEDTLIAANYSIAVLAAIKSLDYGIYENDAEDLIRLILCVVRRLPPGPDVEAGLTVLVQTADRISQSSPERFTPFLSSVVDSCISVLQYGRGSSSSARKDLEAWMPLDFVSPSLEKTGQDRSRLQALLLLKNVPRQFEHRHLLEAAPHVRRALALASGDKVREARKAALAARAAWADV